MLTSDFHGVNPKHHVGLEEHGTGHHSLHAADVLNVHNGWVLVRQKPIGIALFLRKKRSKYGSV